PLSRRGGVSGSDSLVRSLLGAAGWHTAADDLGRGLGGSASLEASVSTGADFILVSDAGDHAEEVGRAFLLHPALEHFYPPGKRIVIPDRLTECGSVMLADALDRLVRELRRVER
ncbi:MAG: ABC transporter substrate-binding protein, partial [Bradyrhizobium sp.]